MKDWRKKHLIRLWLRRWQFLLGLEAWEIKLRYPQVLPPNKPGEEPSKGDAITNVSDFAKKRATIRFALSHMTTTDKIRRTCIHELCHLIADEETKEVHQWIRRLERHLDKIPRRIGGVF